MDVAVFETTHHLNNRVHFANVVKELISQAFACAGAFDQAGDINEFDRSRRQFFWNAKFAAIFSSRGSGTVTMPTFGSMVQKG